MFKTIKSKIIITVILMLTFIMFAFACYAFVSRMKTKQLMVQNYGYSINASFLEDINDRIFKLEDNLKSFALIGSLYYRTDRSTELTNKAVKRILENYPATLGGGIWFKPYIVDKNKKYNSFYVYRDKTGEIILDKNFAGEKYDYPNRVWYKEVISKVTPERNIVWTKPYYEELGSNTLMVTAGTGIYIDNKLVGIATVDWEISAVMEEISKMKPFAKTFSLYRTGAEIKNSFALIGNPKEDYIVATNDPYLDNNSLIGHSLREIPWYADDLYGKTYITYRGKKYVPFSRLLSNGMTLIICVPKSAMFINIDNFYSFLILFGILIVLVCLVFVYYGMNRYIINPIDKLISIARKISKGEDVNIKIEDPKEFAELAATYDKMTKDVKSITKEKERINSELNIAKLIQAASLPSEYPPFPDRDEFDIYAFMEPAREVGGDFFDYYFIDENHFMFLIADVSGKGVPAALFMMTVKTLINNLSQLGYKPKDLINIINKKICENNKQGLFVTMFLSIVDLNSGEMIYVNCGHNPPLVKVGSDEYTYLTGDTNIVLGAFEDFDFSLHSIQLKIGDTVCLYTDGVTEAANLNEELYGPERLLEKVNKFDNDNIMIMSHDIRNDVLKYTKTTERSDDLTVLIFKYRNKVNTVRKTIYKAPSTKENYKQFYQWLHQVCADWELSEDLINKLDMCGEELYANIAFYAYPKKQGDIRVSLNREDDKIIFRFEDDGTPYNPLEKPDPDITLPPEQRPLGGLGIFMVKEITDDISYERVKDTNVLTLVFNI